jgi:lambda family phage minor tail protein L
MSSIHATVQSMSPGEQVYLFRLDTTSIGGPVYYFTQSAHPDGQVSFGGVVYTAVDIDFSDYETNGQGSLPQPKIRFANSNEVIQHLVNTWGDELIGCTVQRVRTFSQFLDGMPEADPTAFYGPDTFEVEQLTDENPVYIEFELSAAFDQQGRKLPGRQMLRDTCTARYRRFKDGAFNYEKASCPYTSAACFDRNANPVTDPAQDVCGRRLIDCQVRFGANAALPTWSFPGMARVRTQ